LTLIKILHRTTYRYRETVSLGPHRLMIRPRESRELRLISSEVAETPPAAIKWSNDVFGNAVAMVNLQTMSDILVIESVTELELTAVAWPIFDIAASAIFYPFQYSKDEWTDLGSLVSEQYSDPKGQLRGWARAFIRSYPTDTLGLLKDLSAGVSTQIFYQSREDEGTQSLNESGTGCKSEGWSSCACPPTIEQGRGISAEVFAACRSICYVVPMTGRSLSKVDRLMSSTIPNGIRSITPRVR
jgi:hypothetical protein